MNPKDFSWQHNVQDWDKLSATFPKLAKLSYPRRILPPTGYANPRHNSYGILAATLSSALPGFDTGPHLTKFGVCLGLIKHQVPTFFVAPDWLDAVDQTEPPRDIKFCDIFWPMDAMTFVIPDSHAWYNGWYVPFLSIAKGFKGTYPEKNFPQWEHPIIPFTYPGDCLLMMHNVWYTTKDAVEYTGTHRLDAPVASLDVERDFTDVTGYESQIMGVKPFSERTAGLDAPTGEMEQKLMSFMQWRTMKILMAASCMPEAVSTGGVARPERRNYKGEVEREQLWHPNIIGKNFIAKREKNELGGSHASPVMHWRKGHFTHQPHGPGRSLRKVLWIQPLLVNAEKKKG